MRGQGRNAVPPLLRLEKPKLGDIMTGSLLINKRMRKEFGSITKIVGIPDLIGMQRNSYESFLQKDVPPEEREEKG